MITGDLKTKIDTLWEELREGGITNPFTVIEQITYLMYSRMLDMQERADEQHLVLTGNDFKPRFAEHQQNCRFSHYARLDADEMLEIVRDQVFQHVRDLARERSNSGSLLDSFMKDARLEIVKPGLLVKAVEMVRELPLDRDDSNGDLYEYLLGKLTTAGINGQFCTPRHIIRAMVEMMEPNPTRQERICDPACGTGGFLSTCYQYLLEKYSSQGSIQKQPGDSGKGEPEEQLTFSGDLLNEGYRHHVNREMFYGYDFDSTMLRIAAMNLIMHGLNEPNIRYQDTISQSFSDRYPEDSYDSFHLILANPPFAGTLEDIDQAILRTVKTKKTELLFCTRILQMLKVGGRSAIVTPQGVLLGFSKAHQSLRKLLVEENQLEAVISLPAGVFKPYAGVATAILIFTKGGTTDDVWFYDLENDGYSLDDKRNPIDKNDLPHLVASWKQYRRSKGLPVEAFIGHALHTPLIQDNPDELPEKTDWQDRTQKAFCVPKADLKANKYDLSLNRYKEVIYEEEQYEPPKEILSRLMALEVEIQQELKELEGML